MVLDFPVGLATATLDGSALTDGILVAIDPAQEHAIDLTADQPADEYSAHVDELVVTGGSVTRTIIVAVDGPTPHLTLPPNVLQRGHTYVIATSCITGGLPNAASGDLQTFAFPIHLGLADGAVFTIAP
jgi:hypothetical protein